MLVNGEKISIEKYVELLERRIKNGGELNIMEKWFYGLYTTLSNKPNCNNISCMECPFNNYGPHREDISNITDDYCGAWVIIRVFGKVVGNAEIKVPETEQNDISTETETGQEESHTVPSLAGTGAEYVRIQGRVKDGKLHIQGKGVSVNRQYGVAVSIDVPEDFLEWVNGQEHTEPSLAGTGAKYVPMQARIKGGLIHIQVKGTPFNREYGAAIDCEIDDTTGPLADFIKAMLDKSAE